MNSIMCVMILFFQPVEMSIRHEFIIYNSYSLFHNDFNILGYGSAHKNK